VSLSWSDYTRFNFHCPRRRRGALNTASIENADVKGVREEVGERDFEQS
jgi:hypothetical protein